MAPKYERPDAEISSTFAPYDATQDNSINASASDIPWKEFFKDNYLKELIQIALEHNADFQVSGLTVERMRALYRIQRAEYLPSVNASGTGTRQRTPWDLNTSGQSMTTNSYQVGLGISSYELDFFGRITSLKNETLEQYLASEEALKAAQMTLISTLANQYYAYLSLKEQYDLAVKTYDSAEQSYQLSLQTYNAGTSSELDLRTAESQREAYRANLASVEESLHQAKNALVFILGQNLPEEPSNQSLKTQELLQGIPEGLPSELLNRRPDILAAEHTLKAANANIGAARAAFFPSVRLTATGGTASADLDGLFKNDSGAWSFAPQISIPIFQGGRNKATLDASKMSKRIEVVNYRKAIQNAFREVSDALAVKASIDTRIDAQKARTQAAQRRYDLSKQRYDAGVDSFLNLLLAQQELFAAEQSLVSAKQEKLSNLVNLYTALGGGWK
jgi:multidrug efflux system outer membrane protein